MNFLYTRWFKYDREICGLFTQKSVPVIFELPCIKELIQSLRVSERPVARVGVGHGNKNQSPTCV